MQCKFIPLNNHSYDDLKRVIVKKLLYIAFNDIENQLFGVKAKILAQCRVFEEAGWQVDLIQRKAAETVILRQGAVCQIVKSRKAKIGNRYARSVLDKCHQLGDIGGYLKGKSFDACYIRFDFTDPGFLGLLKKLRRVCPKILLELPTYPYDDENKAMLLSRVKLAVDKIYRKKLHHYVDRIVTFYGGQDRIFNIPVLTVPNGFDFSTMSMVEEELSGDAIHIIAVSSMREWHGYERFLEGMKRYYQDGGQREIVLHLVGNGREFGKYQSIAQELGSRVVMEGAMSGAPLDALYERCALGIDSLGRHRSGIHVLSSLKSREYGAKGIPMINSCQIDIIGKDFPYLLQVPADETPVDMQTVVDFHDRCFSGKSRQTVAQEIRTYIESKSGMPQTLAPVLDALK